MKRFFFLTYLLLIALKVCGQTNNIVTNTLQGNGYAYTQKINYDTGLMTLYNSEKVYVDIPLVYKSTGERPPFELREKRVEDEEWSFDRTMAIINNAFTLDQKLSVSDRRFSIAIYINSTTGRITDVKYTFARRGPFAQIPLSVFREIEVKLKEEIYFTLTEAGRKVNYVYFGWIHEVK